MQPHESASPQLPELVKDPVASLRPCPVEINVAGHWVLVPARPAADWLELLMGPPELLDMDAIFPGLAEDPEIVEDALTAGQISIHDLSSKTKELLTVVCGRPWYAAMKMLALAQSRWSILGTALMLKGVDPEKVSLSAWLDGLWTVIFEHLPKDQWTRVASQIEAPPAPEPGEAPRDPFADTEMTPDQFTNMLH